MLWPRLLGLYFIIITRTRLVNLHEDRSKQLKKKVGMGVAAIIFSLYSTSSASLPGLHHRYIGPPDWSWWPDRTLRSQVRVTTISRHSHACGYTALTTIAVPTLEEGTRAFEYSELSKCVAPYVSSLLMRSLRF